MKKVLYIAVSILELALVVGAWAVNYFTNKKMGMMRYVVFKNTRWSQKYPIELLRFLTIAAVVVLTAILIILLWKKMKQTGYAGKILLTETAVLSAVYVGFNLIWSVQKLRAFYFISGMLALACFLEILKVLLLLLLQNKKP